MLVLEMGISPDYALDRMEMYEIDALFTNRYLRHRESWEQARMTAFIAARCAGAKIKEVMDLFSFPWDKEEERQPLEKRPATEEEEKRLQAMARSIIENGLMS